MLPELSVGLEVLSWLAQLVILFCAYLVPDFIPLSLVASLMGGPDRVRLMAVVEELQALSLMRVVYSSDG